MRSTSVGRVGRPTGIPTAVADVKKISPWSRQTERPCVSGIDSKVTTRPTSVQKLRPASQLTPAKPAINHVVLETPSTPSRSTTPTSLNRSSSAQKTRTSSIQSIFVKPAAPGTPVPIEQRSKFSTTRATPSKTDNNSISSGSPLGQTTVTPVRSRTPSRTGVSGASNIGSLKAMVGPYSFFLKELKKEKNMYLRDESKGKDLRTIMNQLTLFRLLLDKKLSEDRSTEEKLLLMAWQLVYDAEEEAFGLKSKERIALEINKIHGQLIDMETRITQVNNFLAPVFEKLSTYVNLRMAQVEAKEEVVENSSFIRSVTAKMSASREYSASILNLEKAVRVLERMVEKRDRLLNTSIKSQAGKIDSFHNTPDISPKGSEASTSPYRVGFDPVPSPKRTTAIPPNATVPIAPRHFMAPTTSFRIKVDTPAVKESDGIHSVHDKTQLSAPKKQGSFANSQSSDAQPTTPLKTVPSMMRTNSSSSLNKLSTPKTVAILPGISSSQESPLPLRKAPSMRIKASPMTKATSGIPVHSARASSAAATAAVVAAASTAPAASVAAKTTPSRKNSFMLLADVPDVTIVEDDDEDSDEEEEVEEITAGVELLDAVEALRIDTTNSLSPKGPVPSKELVRTLSDLPRSNSSNRLNSRPGSANGNALKSPGQTVTRTTSATFDDFAKLAKSPTLPRTASSTFDDFASKLASLENLGFASYAVQSQTSKSSTPVTVLAESSQPVVVAPVAVKIEAPVAPQAPHPSTKSVAADFLAKRRAQMNADHAQEAAAVASVVAPSVVSSAVEVLPVRAVSPPSISLDEDELTGTSIEQELAIQSPVAEVMTLQSGSEASVALSKSLEQLQAASPPRSPSTSFFTLSRNSSFREVQPRAESVGDISSSVSPPVCEESIVEATIESSQVVGDSAPAFEDVVEARYLEISAPVVVDTPAPAESSDMAPSTTNGNGTSAYSDFFNKKTAEAVSPLSQQSDDVLAVVEVISVPPLAPDPVPVPVPVATKSAYSNFLAKKSSSLPVSPPSVSYTESHHAPVQSIAEAHSNLKVHVSFTEEVAAQISPVVTPLAAQAINPSVNTKSAYAAFLAKKPSQALAKSDFSYTEDGYVAPPPAEEADTSSMVDTTPEPRQVVTASVAVVAEAERIASSNNSRSAYSDFLKKNTSGNTTPTTNKSESAFAYTETGYSAEPDSAAQSTPVEIAPARVVSTKSAYSDFLARKPSPARDHPGSDATGASFSYTVDTYVAPASSGEHPVAVLETKEELAACAKAVEALASSPVSNVYGDFLKKRSVRTDPVSAASESASFSDLPSVDESVADVSSAHVTPIKSNAYSSFLAKPSFREVGGDSGSPSAPVASSLPMSSESDVSPSMELLSPDSKKALAAQGAHSSFLTKKVSADETALNDSLVATPSPEEDLVAKSSGVLVKKTSFREVQQAEEVKEVQEMQEEVVTDSVKVETVTTSSSSYKVESRVESVSVSSTDSVQTETQHVRHTASTPVIQEVLPPAPQRVAPAAPLTLEEKIALALGGMPPPPPRTESKPAVAGPTQVEMPVVQTQVKPPVVAESPSVSVIAPLVVESKMEPIETDSSSHAGTVQTGIATYSPADHMDTQSVQSAESFDQSPGRPPPAYVQGLPPVNKRPSISSESASVDLSTPKKNTGVHKFLSKTFLSASKKDKHSDSIDLAELSALEGSVKGSVDGGSTTSSALHEDGFASPSDPKKAKSAVSMFRKSLFGSGKKKT